MASSGNAYVEAADKLDQVGQKVEATVSEDGTCGTFVINEEDHTLGNALRYTLAKNPCVDFVGYSVPHPSTRSVNVRVQGRKDHKAQDLIDQGLRDLEEMCTLIKQKFKEEYDTFTMSEETEK